MASPLNRIVKRFSRRMPFLNYGEKKQAVKKMTGFCQNVPKIKNLLSANGSTKPHIEGGRILHYGGANDTPLKKRQVFAISFQFIFFKADNKAICGLKIILHYGESIDSQVLLFDVGRLS